MRRFSLPVLVAASALFPAAAAYALDNVDPYICPTALHGTGTDCFFEAVPQTYTMCRQVKSIEIIEFGYEKSTEGFNGAKSEYCMVKQRINIIRPYQAALREATVSKQAVEGVRSLQEVVQNKLANKRQCLLIHFVRCAGSSGLTSGCCCSKARCENGSRRRWQIRCYSFAILFCWPSMVSLSRAEFFR